MTRSKVTARRGRAAYPSAGRRIGVVNTGEDDDEIVTKVLQQFFAATVDVEDDLGPPAKRHKIIEAPEVLHADFVTLYRGRVAVQIAEKYTTSTCLGRDIIPVIILDLAILPNNEELENDNASIAGHVHRAHTISRRKAQIDAKEDLEDDLRVEIAFSRLDAAKENPKLKAKTNISRRTFRHLQSANLFPSKPTDDASKAAYLVLSQCSLQPPGEGSRDLWLEYQLLWKKDVPGVEYTRAAWLHNEASRLLPGPIPLSNKSSWSPQQFYDSVHCPGKMVPINFVQPEGLETELYPFQARAVDWLLRREQVYFSNDACLLLATGDKMLPSYSLEKDATGTPIYVSRLLESVTSKRPSYRLRGGILAEEMGLGKTVELIALILTHRRETSPAAVLHDVDDLKAFDGTKLVSSNATLIITPPSILEQWKSELELHAPSLKVYHYIGIKANKVLSDQELETVLQEHDVVLTTYSVLAAEIHFARPLKERSRRHNKVYEPRRTPLIRISWWRVCIDEAQLIESGVSNAAQVAQAIPSSNRWGISGTPLRKDVGDLLGLLIFLQYQPFCRGEVWTRVISCYPDVFAAIFGSIAMRHTKSAVRDEIHLPPQKRVTITMSFTATEEHNYATLFAEACQDIGVDLSGGPLNDHWDPESPVVVDRMRTWLRRLRKTCLHAGIVGGPRRLVGGRAGPLRTVEEVLAVMISQNETAIRGQERAMLQHKLMQGHLRSFGGSPAAALKTYSDALVTATTAVGECHAQLEAEQKKIADNKAAAEESSSDDDDADAEEQEKNTHLTIYRQRLRVALEIQHICYFFTATAHFQVKEIGIKEGRWEADSPECHEAEVNETYCYDKAKAIRRELLAPINATTSKLMQRVTLVQSNEPNPWPSIQQEGSFRGLESRKVNDNIALLASAMNQYAKHLNSWRMRLIESLLMPLLDSEDGMEVQGDEYEKSTRLQDEIYVLVEAMRAGLADFHCLLTGQANFLINQEFKTALTLATTGMRDDPNVKGPAPELFSELITKRSALVPPENIAVPTSIHRVLQPAKSFRGIMSDIRSMMTAIEWQGTSRAKAECSILELECQQLQRIVGEKSKQLEKMAEEIDLFRATMNQRLEFYRQLQQISDTVAPLQQEATEQVDELKLNAEIVQENIAKTRLASLRTKQRFLLHLQNESNKTEPEICTICTDTFETGVLTICGHIYCKDCLLYWYNSHRTCPLCKRFLHANDFHQITFKPKELRAVEDPVPVAAEASSSNISPSKSSIYSSLNDATLREIKRIDLPGQSYGVKVDTISRHIIWIRQHDPGTKSIVFSQFGEFLNVLKSAFAAHKIGWSEINSNHGIKKFKEDPAIECFLLNAKADSSGLNLTNATHVFLAEPLINTAIELQAIARVHRIGQRRSTQVYMYVISDTVEEAVYDVSVARRLQHMQKGPEESTKVDELLLENANSLELQTAPIASLMIKGGDGGEMVQKDDLWSCLFSKARRCQGDVSAQIIEGPMGTLLRGEAAENRRDDVRPSSSS